jgi:hypothetical protein
MIFHLWLSALVSPLSASSDDAHKKKVRILVQNLLQIFRKCVQLYADGNVSVQVDRRVGKVTEGARRILMQDVFPDAGR